MALRTRWPTWSAAASVRWKPGQSAVELDRETRPIVLHDLQLGLEIPAPPLRLEPARHRGLDERKGALKPLHRLLERQRHQTSGNQWSRLGAPPSYGNRSEPEPGAISSLWNIVPNAHGAAPAWARADL
jgi:hypothetical protein